MELGKGFSFIGSQHRLEVGGQDFYVDLLFYQRGLRCLVAVDLKTGPFQPEHAGKMNFYLAALDDLDREPGDNPSIGLILCRDHNRVIVETRCAMSMHQSELPAINYLVQMRYQKLWPRFYLTPKS